MLRFAANLSLLFAELPLPRRFAAARKAGFRHVELLFPYEMPIPDLKTALEDNDLRLVLINTPAGDWAGGERGFMGLPDCTDRFRHGVEQALDYAQALDIRYIHLMAGIAPPDQAKDTLTRNLAWAAETAPNQAFTIEPINPFDMPGYALNDFDRAVQLLDQVAAPNTHLQFDAYHAHRITGDVHTAWARYGHRAAHIQIAGYPGRHEPVSGDIDYPRFFQTLEQDRYSGLVSAEYFPKTNTPKGLGWLPSSSA